MTSMLHCSQPQEVCHSLSNLKQAVSNISHFFTLDIQVFTVAINWKNQLLDVQYRPLCTSYTKKTTLLQSAIMWATV